MRKSTSDYRYRSCTVSQKAIDQVVHWFNPSEKSLYANTKKWMDLLSENGQDHALNLPHAFSPRNDAYVIASSGSRMYDHLIVILGARIVESGKNTTFRVEKIGLLPQKNNPVTSWLGEEPSDEEKKKIQLSDYKKQGRQFLNAVKKYSIALENKNSSDPFDIANPVDLQSALPEEWVAISEAQTVQFLHNKKPPFDERWWDIVNTFDDAFRHQFMHAVVSEIRSNYKDFLNHMVHAWCMLGHAVSYYYQKYPKPWRILREMDDIFSNEGVLMLPKKELEKPFFFLSDKISNKPSVFHHIRTLQAEWPQNQEPITYEDLKKHKQYTDFVDYICNSITGKYGFHHTPITHITDLPEFQQSTSFGNLPSYMQAWLFKDKDWKELYAREIHLYNTLNNQQVTVHNNNSFIYQATKQHYTNKHQPDQQQHSIELDFD